MKGTYVLIVNLRTDKRLKIGKLGAKRFKTGAYAYVGSALNNLEARIERHLSNEKKLHWHIDYLLPEAEIISVICGETNQRKECEVAENLAENLSTVPGFGASDCNCRSHLFYGGLKEVEEKMIESFKRTGLEPERWS